MRIYTGMANSAYAATKPRSRSGRGRRLQSIHGLSSGIANVYLDVYVMLLSRYVARIGVGLSP